MESINDVIEYWEDLVLEIELIKQVEINIDYLLGLIVDYLAMKDKERDKQEKDGQGLADVMRVIGASPSLRDKEELVRQFVDSLSADIVELPP